MQSIGKDIATTTMNSNMKPKNRAAATVMQLRSEIMLGNLEPGDLLAEASVAERLGISRVPVREALFMMEREGLVDFSPTGRAYVKKLSPRDFEELYVLRLALEPLAAKLAAAHVRANLWELEANVAATENATSIPDMTRLDLDFHQIILARSGNTRLLKLWSSLRSELELWLGRLHRLREIHTKITRTQTVSTHREIIDCFRQQSPAACERMIAQHIQSWRDWLPNSESVLESK